jgi:hypothetical protein
MELPFNADNNDNSTVPGAGEEFCLNPLQRNYGKIQLK